MSKLDELIKKYCPDGVEYKKLGDIATISRGGNFQKKDYVSTGVPCIHYGQLYVHYDLFTDNVITYIHKDKAVKQKFAEPNDIIMAVTSENIEDVCKSIAWLGEEKVAVSGHSAIIHHSMNPKYLAYYLNSLHFYKQKVKLAHGTKVIEVTPSALNEVSVPVPPLPVQEEIVRILDSFTSLTAELQDKLPMELQTRKKQYEYYKNMILALENEHPVPLKSICNNIYSGKNKKRRDNGIFPVYGSTGIISRTDCAIYHKKQILIARVGANAGYVHIADGDYDVSDNTLIVDVNNDVSLKYIYYQLSSMNLHKYAKGGGQPLVTASQMKEIMLPLPSKNKQQKIVDILDRFDTLCNDITTGIPAEIAARQKQYEYYRDKLLTFKELS